MGNHVFNVTVVLFWLATMGWLVVAKVLPPMRVGEPPSYRSILAESQRQLPVCWSIHLEDRPIGWAANRLVRRADGISELHSRVYLQDLPLDELAPGWLANVLKPVLRDLGPLDIDKQSSLVVDPLGRLVGFESHVRIAEIRDAIKVQGQIEGSSLKLTVQSGEMPHKFERYLPPNALVTDELSPQTSLPGLRVGQSWTVPLYSPFRPPTSPIEVLQARVERAEAFTWDGARVASKLIVYRGDPGSGLSGDEARGRMWVRDDGMVLRQEVTVLRSRLNFLRLPDRQAARLANALGSDWSGTPDVEMTNEILGIATECP
ncbi:MAG: hypothetical protein AB7O59_09175 [Pirellulales bacterium]